VFQRPFSTGDPEIAGFEGDTPDRRAAAQSAGSGGGGAVTNTPSLGRRAYEKGLLTFVWRAEDENRDILHYDVLYRGEGETVWKPLKKGLENPILVWDTTSVPNGRYVMQVMVTDLPSNSPDAALTGSMESTTFEIDNMPPTVTVTAVRRPAPISRSRCWMLTQRFRRRSTRWTAIVGRRFIPKTALPTRGPNSSS
jgi:hypothetical protein